MPEYTNDSAITALVNQESRRAVRAYHDKICDAFTSEPNAKRFPPAEYLRIYHAPKQER